MTKIKFGTDGWRALMDTDFTEENVARLAQAFAGFMLKQKSAPRVAVGYDFRKHSENFAALVCRILVANGIETILSDRAVPTPAVSRAVIDRQLDAGVVLTASHNPGGYNGFKIKDSHGSSAELDITRGVESLLDASAIRMAGEEVIAACLQDLVTPYLDGVRRYLDFGSFSQKPFRILMDSMHGVGVRYVEQLLRGTSIEVTTVRAERDVTFGGVAPEPIPKNFKATCELMKQGKFDAAFVTDGDADRIGAVRPGGEFVSPGKILSLIMLHLAEDLGRRGDVVTTVSNTALIYKTAQSLGLKTHETPVGFKYVVDLMHKHNVLIAGEESGGLAFQDYMFERDGVLSALLVIQMMGRRGQSFEAILSGVEKRLGKFLYARSDMNYPEELKPRLFEKLQALAPADIEGVRVLRKNTLDGVKFELDKDAWLLFRVSGTEPLLRVYAESVVPGQAEQLVAWGERLALSLRT